VSAQPPVTITITADASGVRVGVQQATQQVTQLVNHAQRVSQRLHEVGAGLTQLGYGFAAALAVPIAYLLKLGFEFERIRQTAQIAFTVFMGGARQAAEHIRELTQLAIESPFELKDVLLGSQRLQAMGVAAGRVVGILRTVADVAAGTGLGAEGIDRITLALGKIVSAGRVTGREIRSLEIVGVNATKILAAHFGTTFDEMRKLISKGQVRAGEAIDALIQGMNAKFGGLSKAQAFTFAGLFSTIHDVVSRAAADLFAPVFSQFQEFLIALLPHIDAFVAGFNSLSPATRNFVLGVSLAAAAVGPLLIVLGALAPAIGTLIATLGGPLIAAIVGAAAAAALFGGAFAADFLGVRTVIFAVLGAAGDLFSFLNDNRAVLAALAVAFGGLTAAVLAYNAAAIAAAVASASAGVLGALAALGPVISAVTGFLGSMVAAVRLAGTAMQWFGTVSILTGEELALATGGLTLLLGLLAAGGLALYAYGSAETKLAEVTADQITQSGTRMAQLQQQSDFLRGLGDATQLTGDQQERYNTILDTLTPTQRTNLELTERQAEATGHHTTAVQVLAGEIERLRNLQQKELETEAAVAAVRAVEGAQALDAERAKREQLITVMERLAQIRDRLAAQPDTPLPANELAALTRQLEALGQSDIAQQVRDLQNIGSTAPQIRQLNTILALFTDSVTGMAKPITDATANVADLDARLKAAEAQTGLSTRGVLELAARLGLFRGNLDEAVAAVARYRVETKGATSDVEEQNKALANSIDLLRKQKQELELPGQFRRAQIDLAIAVAFKEARERGVSAAQVFNDYRRQGVILDGQAVDINKEIIAQQRDEAELHKINEGLQTKGHTVRVAHHKAERTELERLTEQQRKLTAQVAGFYEAGSKEFALRYRVEDLDRLKRDLEHILDLRHALGLPLDTPLPKGTAAIRIAGEQLESYKRVQDAVTGAQHERLKAEEALATAILTQGLPIAAAELVAQERLIDESEKRRRAERDLTADLRVLAEQRRQYLTDEGTQLHDLLRVYTEFRIDALQKAAAARLDRMREQLRLAVLTGNEDTLSADIRVRIEREQAQAPQTPVQTISTNVEKILGVLQNWLAHRDDAAAGGGGLDVGAGGGGARFRRTADIAALVREMGFAPGAGYDPTHRKHNAGSLHYTDQALDVPTGGYTRGQVNALIATARAAGLVVLDERQRPKDPNQKWTGPHLHLQVDLSQALGAAAGQRAPVTAAVTVPAGALGPTGLELPGYAPFTPLGAADFPSTRAAAAAGDDLADEAATRIDSLRSAINTLDVLSQTQVDEAYAAADKSIGDMIERIRALRAERQAETDPTRAEQEGMRALLELTEAVGVRDKKRRDEARAADTDRGLALMDYTAAVQRETGYVLRILGQADDERLRRRLAVQNDLIVLEDDLAAAQVRDAQYVSDQLAEFNRNRLSDSRKLLDDIFAAEQELAQGIADASERRYLAQLKAIREVRDADEEAVERQIAAQVRLADAQVLHSEQARAAVLDHLAKQTTYTEAVASSITDLYDRALKPIDGAIDRITAKWGILGTVANNFFKMLARQLLNRVFTRLLDAILPPTDARTAAGAGEEALSRVRQAAGGGGPGDGQQASARQMNVTAQTVVINAGAVTGAGGAQTNVAQVIIAGAQGAAGGGAGGGQSIGARLLGAITSALGGGAQGAQQTGVIMNAQQAAAAGIQYDGGTTGATRPRRAGAAPPPAEAAKGFFDRFLGGKLSGLRDLFRQVDPKTGAAIPGSGIFNTKGGGFGFGNSGFASMLPMLGMSLGGQFGGMLGAAGGLIGSIGLISPGAVGLSATSFLAPLFSNPITAIVGGALLVGGILLKRNMQRRADEKTRTDILLSAKDQLRDLVKGLRGGGLDSAAALSQATSIRQQYLDAVAQLKDKKTRDIATATVRELDWIIENEVKPAAAQAEARGARAAAFSPTFNQGGNLRTMLRRYRTGGRADHNPLDLLAGYGLVDGYYDALDSHVIAVTGREVVLAPRDQAALGLTPEKMKQAGVRGFAQAGAVTPPAAPSKAAPPAGDGRPVVIVAIGDKAIAAAVEKYGADAVMHIIDDDITRNGASGLLGSIADGNAQHGL
jgi:tape measure domain-containing protein